MLSNFNKSYWNMCILGAINRGTFKKTCEVISIRVNGICAY